jgi:transposase
VKEVDDHFSRIRGRIKQFREMVARYDKTARNFPAAIHLASVVIRLN